MGVPSIIIAGTNSGCGKTTISTGIMGLLTARGLKVQSFKVGPDYIDPMFHTFITGRASRNLDSWMLDRGVVEGLFSKNSEGADIAVVEGVMGLYDGFGGYSRDGSTADVAGIIKAPVILVVNGEGMSLSIVPLVKGFIDFDGTISIKGVIINNIKSEAHFLLLKRLIQEQLDIAVIGYLKRMPEIGLKSRHLGLVPEDEVEGLRDKIASLSSELEKTLDIDLLLNIAGEGGKWDRPVKLPPVNEAVAGEKVRIAVAGDKAFNFYYRDNLDLLEALGAELVYFSPLADSQPPEDIGGMYLGGGYPEVWAEELQNNTGMRAAIKGLIEAGLPVYAECGGLMYLSGSIITGEGASFDMVGAIPGVSRMTGSLQRFGYVELEAAEDNIAAHKGEKIRGHEFHYSTTDVPGDIIKCLKVTKTRGNGQVAQWECGYKVYSVLASYPHLHFWSNPGFAQRFVEKCREWKNMKNGRVEL